MMRNATRRVAGICFLATVSVYSSTPELSDSILGRYKAVTESEWNFELELRKEGVAVYTLSSYEADESAKLISKTEVQARWNLKGEVLSVTLSGSKPDQVITYDVSACLSYKWFGGSSCSPGLQPTGTGVRQPYVQPLWNAKTFKFP